MFSLHSRPSSNDASSISSWSCNNTSQNDTTAMLLQPILLHCPKQKKPSVKFSKVLIINDSTPAIISKDASIPGFTKNVIDRYYSNQNKQNFCK